MNLGLYHRRRSAKAQQGLPLSNLQYGELAAPSSTQAALRHPSFEGIPREQYFLTSSSSVTYPGYNLTNPMSMMPQSHIWDDQFQMGSFADPNGNSFDSYSSFAANDDEGTLTRGIDLDAPRYITSDIHGNSFNNMSDACEHNSYIAESSNSSYLQGPAYKSHLANNGLDSSRDFARLSISRSPLLNLKFEHDDLRGDPLQFERAPAFRLTSSETSEDGGFSSREMTAIDDEQAAEEPYAKLIHRALMSAPNHSMVLQEIYQWFREHTIKGSAKDGNKGWMNSIRHNLSMNAAFKKTERKMQGDETKKSTEWVLEEFAIKDGVQSTTRYRKGTNAKKFTRNDHPAAARQSSGRKGGNATSASKNRFQRRRSEVRDTRRAAHMVDRSRRSEFEQMTRSYIASRQRSPLTPPAADRHVAHQHFFGKAPQELLESPSPYDPDSFAMSDSPQSIYLDSLLFSSSSSSSSSGSNLGHDGQQHIHDGPTLARQRFG